MSDFLSFHLPDDFVESYALTPPNWGYPIGGGNFLSELIYVDKYSALKEDGTKERWYETVRRCVEGYYSILKDHCKSNRTPWNDFKAQASAKDAYDRMFNFKWLPPGRGLQHMGRPIVHKEQNSAALQNCAFLSTEKLSTHSVEEAVMPFVRMMEMSMWGIGCIAEGSWVTTQEGPRRIEDIQTETSIISGSDKHAAPLGAWFTGTKPTVVVKTVEGFEVQCTPDHRVKTVAYSRTTNNRVVEHFDWVEAQDLQSGDLIVLNPTEFEWAGEGSFDEGYLIGACLGDGWKESHSYVVAAYSKDPTASGIKEQCLASIKPYMRRVHSDGFRRKNSDCEVLTIGTWVEDFLTFSPKMMTDRIEMSSYDFYRGFLRGLFDADGGVVDAKHKGVSIKLTQSNYDTLRRVQRMLLRLGIKSSISIKRSKSIPTVILGRKTVSNPSWTLVISRTSVSKFREIVGFSTGPKLDRLNFVCLNHKFLSTRFDARVLSVEPAGDIATFDMSVPEVEEFDANGIKVHNCGFDTKGAGKLTIHEPNIEKSEIFVVPDNREGWAESVGKLLESYFFKNRPSVEFDYSEVRPSGTPLVRFGGRASGPGPLITLHQSLRSQLDKRAGELITSRDIVDIENKIGKAVVAGGARRSAQICFGDVEDTDYINIKNWNLPENAERTGEDGWAWNSNNSVFVGEGQNYEPLIDSIVESGGEPGFMWLKLAQDYGRLIDPPDFKDKRAAGGNPCLEQTLESGECCTLVETFPNKHETFQDFRETLKHAYLYGKAVTLMPTAWPETNEVMARNRRIGCSMSGLAEFIDSRGWSTLRSWMDDGYQAISHRDKKYSEWLAVRESIKKTSIKPSGTVSIVATATPGVHWPVSSGSYIRRVRFSWHNPIVDRLIDAGYEVEPAVDDPNNTAVVTFITEGQNIRNDKEVSLWEKAELAVLAQRYWADNQVSATLTFKEQEVDQILPVISSKEGQFKGVSLLPLGDKVYPQMPYETLPEGFKSVKVKSLGDLYSAGVEAFGDKFCDTDVCTL